MVVCRCTRCCVAPFGSTATAAHPTLPTLCNVHVGVVKSNHLERTTFYGKDVQEERKQFRQTVRAMPISQTPQEVRV